MCKGVRVCVCMRGWMYGMCVCGVHVCVLCVCVCRGEEVKVYGEHKSNIYCGFLACLQPVPRLSANSQPSPGTVCGYHLEDGRRWKSIIIPLNKLDNPHFSRRRGTRDLTTKIISTYAYLTTSSSVNNLALIQPQIR